MKESKKAILKSLSKTAKKNDRFDMLVLNMALQKIDCENFDFDGDAVYTVVRGAKPNVMRGKMTGMWGKSLWRGS